MTDAERKTQIDALLREVERLDAEGGSADALARAWDVFELAPADIRAKRVITNLLRRNADVVSPERLPELDRLLHELDVDPSDIAPAAWRLILSGLEGCDEDPAAIAKALEGNAMALLLLSAACVPNLDVEAAMTKVRRWLLLSGQWNAFPRLSEALTTQAKLNEGAWPFDVEERDQVERRPRLEFAAAYLPTRNPIAVADSFDDSVTQAVADQYFRWPYPTWSRRTAPEPTTVPRVVETLDGGRPSGLPVKAEILIAGCGTGWDTASFAMRFPDARVTAIDISAGSLAYASERCAGLNVDFHLLDLHEVSTLNRRFDVIASSGVLHHLPEPEAGWAKLVDVLNPGGVMKVMLYSRVGRLAVEGAKRCIADLRSGPVNDEVLREARRRLIDQAPNLVSGYSDFYSLSGVHDLLFNRQEHLFDVPRIVTALDRLGLRLLGFKLPTASDRANYLATHPADPLFRDVDAWAGLEKSNPFLFSSMYEFWCRKSL